MRRTQPGIPYRRAVPRHRVLVSAHRCGYAELGTVGGREDPLAGVEHSVRIGADYCEFDVRRCVDGTFVISHDAAVGADDRPVEIKRATWAAVHEAAPEVLTLTAFLEQFGRTGLGAHVDVKFGTPDGRRASGEVWEHDLLEALTAYLDPTQMVLTTGRGDATQAFRTWLEARGLSTPVALSIGTALSGMPWRQAVMSLYGQLFPRRRFELSRADAVAAHFALAMARLSRWTSRIGVPLLVWTVDSARLQKRFLHDRRIWMVTTNHPAQAVALRDR
jgi:glycerophosphoryl diester phosphodiesterase